MLMCHVCDIITPVRAQAERVQILLGLAEQKDMFRATNWPVTYAGELDKAVFLSRRREIDQAMAKRRQERADLEDRLRECGVLSPEQEEALLDFRRKVEQRFAMDVPPVEQAKLFDLLQVKCVYDDQTGELAVSGLMGERQLLVRSWSVPAPTRPGRRCSYRPARW
jgi:hypothetical protein